MTRAEAIGLIEATLPRLDDMQAEAVAAYARSLLEPALTRPLTERERRVLLQSAADFEAGRTLDHDELLAALDQRLSNLGVPTSR